MFDFILPAGEDHIPPQSNQETRRRQQEPPGVISPVSPDVARPGLTNGRFPLPGEVSGPTDWELGRGLQGHTSPHISKKTPLSHLDIKQCDGQEKLIIISYSWSPLVSGTPQPGAGACFCKEISARDQFDNYCDGQYSDWL